jgi:hypothetical protein
MRRAGRHGAIMRDRGLCANTGGEAIDVCDDKCVRALDAQQKQYPSICYGDLVILTHERTRRSSVRLRGERA